MNSVREILTATLSRGPLTIMDGVLAVRATGHDTTRAAVGQALSAMVIDGGAVRIRHGFYGPPQAGAGLPMLLLIDGEDEPVTHAWLAEHARISAVSVPGRVQRHVAREVLARPRRGLVAIAAKPPLPSRVLVDRITSALRADGGAMTYEELHADLGGLRQLDAAIVSMRAHGLLERVAPGAYALVEGK